MAYLIFDNGKVFEGNSFGFDGAIDGELVFNTDDGVPRVSH